MKGAGSRCAAAGKANVEVEVKVEVDGDPIGAWAAEEHLAKIPALC